ncbi:hypothetical protein [Chryseobacterium sp. T1]
MKKEITLILVTCISALSFSQSGKVGIATSTPTEILDVKGTMRVRSLPNNGSTNSIFTTGVDTNSGTSPTQTFNAVTPVVVDANGVLGKNTAGELVNNNNATGFNPANNTSTATFVVKRFTLKDDVGGLKGTYNNATGFDTGMDSTNWQAIMSNVMITINSNTASPFAEGSPFNYRLKTEATGNWRIVGDIVNSTETLVVDVLFIKSKFVAADSRLN